VFGKRILLDTILQITQAMIVVIDRKGMIIFTSDNLNEFAGYSSMKGKYPWDFMPPDLKDFAKAHIQEHLRNGVPPGDDPPWPLMTKSGEIKYIKVRSKELHDPHGRVEYIVSNLLDVTSEIRAQERIDKLMEMESVATFIHHNGQVLRMSQGAEQLLGYKISEIEGHPFPPPFMPEDQVEKVKTNIQKRGEKPIQIEFRRQDGTRFPVLVDAKNIEYQGLSVRLAVVHAVNEEGISKLLETSSFAAFIAKEGVVLQCNEGLLKLTGFSRDEVIGKWLPWTHPDEMPKIKRIVKTQPRTPQRVRIRKKDGSILNIIAEGWNVMDQRIVIFYPHYE
jgi:PAS domain S-box-containing protein